MNFLFRTSFILTLFFFFTFSTKLKLNLHTIIFLLYFILPRIKCTILHLFDYILYNYLFSWSIITIWSNIIIRITNLAFYFIFANFQIVNACFENTIFGKRSKNYLSIWCSWLQILSIHTLLKLSQQVLLHSKQSYFAELLAISLQFAGKYMLALSLKL